MKLPKRWSASMATLCKMVAEYEVHEEPYKSRRLVASGGMSTLPIVIAVDVDPDWRIPDASGTPYRGEVQWLGLLKGVPRMLDSSRRLTDSQGRHLRFTWLLRSDDQMASLMGDPAFLADKFAEFWRERVAQGDEIGWHPHTWRLSERDHVWYQEQNDIDCLPEVPNWTFPFGWPRRFYHRIRARSERDFANPAKLPYLVRQAFKKPPSTVPFVCSFHPEELLGRTALFAGRNFVDNLSALLSVCERRGVPTRMTVASEIRSEGPR